MERRSVDIGSTALDASVAGNGPVTVVFENGMGTSLEEWDAIAPRISERARTLRYDRRRAPAAGRLSPRTGAEMASDLEQLLAALALSPPYVLVGHSWGPSSDGFSLTPTQPRWPASSSSTPPMRSSTLQGSRSCPRCTR